MSSFERLDSETVSAEFSTLEAELLQTLASQVGDLLDTSIALPADAVLSSIGIGGSDRASLDPAIARLLPDAYADDAEASSEFRRLTENGLAQRKIDNARGLATSIAATDIATAERIILDAAAQQSWLRTLTDIRLVLASRLRVDSTGEPQHGTDGDISADGGNSAEEQSMMVDVYHWLGSVQESLLSAMEVEAP